LNSFPHLEHNSKVFAFVLSIELPPLNKLTPVNTVCNKFGENVMGKTKCGVYKIYTEERNHSLL